MVGVVEGLFLRPAGSLGGGGAGNDRRTSGQGKLALPDSDSWLVPGV